MLARKLVIIKQDVALEQQTKDLNLGAADSEQLKQLYERFEFKNWLKEVNETAGAEIAASSAAAPEEKPDASACEIIFSQAQLKKLIARLKKEKLFAVDTETSSLDYMAAEIIGVSFAFDNGDSCYIPVAHDYENVSEQLDRDFVLAELKPLLENSKLKKIGHHLKYDANVFANYDIELAGIAHDSMLEAYIFNSNGRHDLDTVAKKYLAVETIKYEDVAGKGAKQIPFAEVDIVTAAEYSAEDSLISMELHKHLWPQLEADAQLKRVYETIEMPLVPVLAMMEQTGIKLDSEQLAEQSKSLVKQLKKLERQAEKLVGYEFNMNSPKQLQQILFEEQGLPVFEKTPKGAPSTSESALQALAHEYELPHVILQYRGLYKLLSTYVDKLPTLVAESTGRLHTSYHQATTVTGRLSSSNPNLQNIPIRTEEGRKIRDAFVTDRGWRIISADYSQIELRIMAHLSKDKGLLKAFANGLDIHSATAAEIFHKELADVSANERRSAKAINFGLIYGMSAFGLAKQLGLERKEAQFYIDRYFEKYPGVQEYMDNTQELAAKQGYVETLFGRRLYTPEINSKNQAAKRGAQRAAINAPMQGTAADIIKLAMLKVAAWIEKEEPPVRMLLQVHDELIFEVKHDYVDQVKDKIRELMAAAAKLSVPLDVEVGSGTNWGSAH